MIHPDTELRFISPEIGYGVVATRFIPKGTITWALDKFDRLFSPVEFNSFEKVYQDILHKYTYRNNKGEYILCWDHARFVNHSFNSNCVSTAYEFEIAVRDIQPGEELTDDYGYLNVEEPFECIPEPGCMRKKVMPDDLLKYSDKWDEQVMDAIAYFRDLHQPLIELLPGDIREKAMKISAGEAELDSIINCYFNANRFEVPVMNGSAKSEH